MEVKELRRRIMEVLEYDPETGLFRWKVRINPRCSKGWFKGPKNGRGYRQINVLSVQYRAHSLAWLIFCGRFPEYQVDHKNGDRGDNRISNLRDIQQKQNCRNAKRSAANTSGFTGVRLDSRYMKWQSRIGVDGKEVYLGSFSSAEEAIIARKNAEVKYGFSSSHGEQK